MQDNKMASELLEQMTRTLGWEIVKSWIDEKIDNAKKRLLTVEPTDVKKIVEYQTTIKNYAWLLSKINDKVVKKQEE